MNETREECDGMRGRWIDAGRGRVRGASRTQYGGPWNEFVCRVRELGWMGYLEDEPERFTGFRKKEWKSTTCIQEARTPMRSIAMSRCYLFLFVR